MPKRGRRGEGDLLRPSYTSDRRSAHDPKEGSVRGRPDQTAQSGPDQMRSDQIRQSLGQPHVCFVPWAKSSTQTETKRLLPLLPEPQWPPKGLVTSLVRFEPLTNLDNRRGEDSKTEEQAVLGPSCLPTSGQGQTACFPGAGCPTRRRPRPRDEMMVTCIMHRKRVRRCVSDLACVGDVNKTR